LADVFLSYARGDRAAAERLARAIGETGLTVWWDRHIKGGAEFSRDIEQQLEAASRVLVLWSKEAVGSRWVRDEASVAADSGRLVSATVDGTPPPLGFRQFQTIDLKKWAAKGTAIPPDLFEALDVETPAVSRSTAPSGRRTRLLTASVVALLLLVSAVGAWLFIEQRSEASEPVLAVMPFSDLSPGRDKAYFAEGVAEAILTVLAKEGGIRVIGRSTAQQLQDAGADAERMRRALGVTHVLEGSARSAGNDLRMSVRLIGAADGRQLWAEEYQRRLDNVFAVQDEIGRAVAQRLKGSFARAAHAPAPTNADVYTLYLAARAKMRDRRMSSLQDALKIARQVIATDPKFAPGHALFAEVIYHLSFDNYGNLPPARARQIAEPHAREAIRLAPDKPEGYAALGMVLAGGAAIEPLTTAIRLDPARAELRLWLAQALFGEARQEEALRHVVAATEIDPLWAPGMWSHSYVLSASGMQREAEAVIQRFEQRGGSPAIAALARGNIAGWSQGDYSEAVRHIRFALAKDAETPVARQSLAWSYRTLGFPQQAAEAAKVLPLYTQLLLAHDLDQLRSRVLSDRATFWQQPDPDSAVEGLALARDWAALESLHDQDDIALRTVCSTPRAWFMQEGIHLASALAARNRASDARRYLKCLKPMLAAQGRGRFRSMYLSQAQIELFWAQIHALEGQPRPAFERLDRAVRAGIRTRYSAGLSDLPTFDRYRGTAEYQAMDARLKQLIARERAEVLGSS